MPNIAGKIRDVNVVAGGTSVIYCRPKFIEPALQDAFGALERANYLSGLPQEQFANDLADTWAYVTQIHPFRDGNTRSQSLYFDRLARAAGYLLQWETIDPNIFRQLCLQAVTGKTVNFASYIHDHIRLATKLTRDQPKRDRAIAKQQITAKLTTKVAAAMKKINLNSSPGKPKEPPRRSL